MNIQLRNQLTKSVLLCEDPAQLVGQTVFALRQAIDDIDVLRGDPLAQRHVFADRNEIQRLAVRLARVALRISAP